MTLYEHFLTNNSSLPFFSINWKAHTFTVGTVSTNENFNITSTKILIYRDGNPGTITVSIQSVDGSSKPSGVDLSSGTTDGNTLTTDFSGEWREIIMSSYELQASTKYAIVARISGGDSSNEVRWRNNNLGGYAGGSALLSSDSGSTWSTLGNDFAFEIHGTAAVGTNMQLNIGDTWKEIPAVQINIGDTWKEVVGIQQNIGDTWKEVF